MEHKTKNKAGIIAICGFTLMELIAAIAISALLVFFTVLIFTSFRNTQVLQGETSQALLMINKARSNTLNSKGDSEYGVRINANQLILFKGAAFASSSPDNEAHILHSAVAIPNVALTGGGLDIIFDRLTGETQNDGSLIISLKSNPAKKNTVFVNKTGVTSQN